MIPQREQRWLEPGEFRTRAGLALDRHRRDALRFELHRLEFPGPLEAWARFCELLPGHVRDMDGLSRPQAGVVVLLVAGEAEAFARLRRRLLAVWEGAWQAAGLAPPAAAFVDRSIGLAGAEDAEAFLSAADVWVAESGPNA